MKDDRKGPGAAFAGGLISASGALRLGLGLCPALAVTVTAFGGLAIGLATAFAVIGAGVVVSWLKDALNRRGRVVAALMIGALCATLARTLLRLFWPALDTSLGVFVPLIAVNSLIVFRLEYAAEHSVVETLFGGMGVGLSYAFALTLIGAIRELLGRGSVFGVSVMPAGYEPVLMMILPAGGLLVCGLMLGAVNAAARRRANRGKGASA